MAKKFLTLNIGASFIELAEYEAGAKGALTLLRYGTAKLDVPLDFETADTILSPALLGLVRDTGIKPGKVAMSVMGQMVFPKFAAIPAAGGDEKFEQMVRYEIEQNIPFPIDEMVCDRQVLGDTENGDKAVMIVAAKIAQVEALTNAVMAAGFTPEIVDSAPTALTNAVRYNHPEDADACTITLWLGSKATNLIITEGDKIYTRLIQVGSATIAKEVSAALGCSPEEAQALVDEKGYVSLGGVTEDEDEVADRISKVCRAVMTRLNAEVSRSVNFYRSQQGGGMPEKVYITGALALLPQIDQFFTDALQIPVEFLNPFERVGVGPKVDVQALETDGALLAATVGLAVHAVGAARFAINLLPPALVQARAEKARIPFVAVGGAALVAALVLVMLAIGRQTEVIEAQRDAVQAKVSALKTFDKKVEAAQQAVEKATSEAEAMRKLLDGRSAAVQRVNAVRSSLAPGMWIERWDVGRVTVRYWKDRVKVATGKTAGELVVDKLKGKPAVVAESVKISDMSVIGKEGQVEQFTVELKFK